MFWFFFGERRLEDKRQQHFQVFCSQIMSSVYFCQERSLGHVTEVRKLIHCNGANLSSTPRYIFVHGRIEIETKK